MSGLLTGTYVHIPKPSTKQGGKREGLRSLEDVEEKKTVKSKVFKTTNVSGATIRQIVERAEGGKTSFPWLETSRKGESKV
ncbi:hypothetical protein IAR50_004370 [Cryptococcus sp. DSM 104548]